jgi:hypothetical protein
MEHGDADRDDRPLQNGTHYQIRNLWLPRRNDAFMHFGVGCAREWCAEWTGGAKQLLSFGVEQDNYRSLEW